MLAGTASAVLITNGTAADETFRIIALYYTVLVSLGIMLLWWLFFSGMPWRNRIAGVVLVSAVGVGSWFGLVRRLDFNGAMLPKPVWIWQQSAEERRREWVTQQNTTEPDDGSLDVPFQVTADDWPQYCGPGAQRTVPEPLINCDWVQSPPQELWRRPVGEAWSSFAVVGPRLFSQEQRSDQECVVCYHADTGAELWVHRSSTRYETAMGGIGPRATPTVSSDSVFTLGATGLLTCLDPITGNQQWQQDVTETASAKMPIWGFSGSPLLLDDLVIVITGGRFGTVAFRQDSGEIAWKGVPHRTGYSSARLEEIDGQNMLLVFYGDGLSGLDPDNGTEQWHYPFTNMYHVNAAQPISFGGLIFIGTGYDGKCVAVNPRRLADGVPEEAWAPNNHLNLKFNEAVERDGFVYGLDDGILTCVELETGKRMWKGGRYRHGQVLLWADMLLVQAEKGYVALVNASPARFREITRFAGLSEREDGVAVKAWNVPVVNRGRLYMRTDREAACWDLSGD